MVVMTERQSWNDDRLDDLNHRVDSGFKELRAETNAGFAQLRTEIQAGDAQLRAEMNTGFAEMNGRFDSLQRTLILIGAALNGTLIAAVVAAIAAT
jgi:hypothetical protein